MTSKGIGLVVIAAVAWFSVGCADTCKEMCGFAADYYEECLPEWNSSWEDFDASWSTKADFRKACIESADTGRSQVSDCCPDEEIEAACEGSTDVDCAETKKGECENNTLLAIDRNCEDNKDLFRQPCHANWQSVYEIGGPGFPDENPTCAEIE